MKKLAIIGASGHGKVIADIAIEADMKKSRFLMITKKYVNVQDFRLLELRER